MRHKVTCAALAAAVALAGGGAEAQEMAGGMMMERGPSRFDLGVYAGGAYTTDWFESRRLTLNGTTTPDEDEGEGFRIGFAPIFGANATFWARPSFGLRLHYGYMPSQLPERDGDEGGTFDDGFIDDEDDNYIVNNHFYDLSLIFRLPGLPLLSSLSSNLYGWVGGGGLTTNVAGEGGCELSLVRAGACLSRDPDHGSVGQGVVGIGGDVVSLSNNIGLFAEAAAHIYDSPVHVGDGFLGPITARTGQTVRVADDRIAVTPRLVLGLKAAFGSFEGPAPIVVPPPIIEQPLPPPPAPVDEIRTINVCVVQGGALREVQAQYNVTRGDTLVNGQPFSTAFPATTGYAAGASWFINSDVITINGQRYVKFGLPRVVGVNDVTRMTDYQGVPVFAESGAGQRPEIVYVPVRPGCEFQPYQREQVVRGVRG